MITMFFVAALERLLIFTIIFFFFQAEDGIRDDLVTGVQTCALPILVKASLTGSIIGNILLVLGGAFLAGGIKFKRQQFNTTAARAQATLLTLAAIAMIRSEERRVGKECRGGGGAYGRIKSGESRWER